MLVGHSMQGRGASLIFLFLSFSFFLLTPGEVISEKYTSDYGKAIAARKAAVFVVELGLQQISFEGDDEGVIKALSQKDVTHSPVGHLVKDFRSITSSLGTFSLSHTRRQGNNVAHALAWRARFSFSLLVWMEDVPPNILHYVLEDFPS